MDGIYARIVSDAHSFESAHTTAPYGADYLTAQDNSSTSNLNLPRVLSYRPVFRHSGG
jgi:hypothetical protein